MDKIKVLAADDQMLILDGIRIILESQPDIEVVATVSSGRAAVEAALAANPDVVLMDIQMPDMSGIEALRQIKAARPQTVVLMLTTFDPDEYILGAFRSGADGYLLKDLSGDRLALAIRDAHAGYSTVPVAIAARLISQIPSGARKQSLREYDLTVREMEIAGMMAQGSYNEQMARALGLTAGTVKNYVSSIYSKLGVENRQQAIELIAGLLAEQAAPA